MNGFKGLSMHLLFHINFMSGPAPIAFFFSAGKTYGCLGLCESDLPSRKCGRINSYCHM